MFFLPFFRSVPGLILLLHFAATAVHADSRFDTLAAHPRLLFTAEDQARVEQLRATEPLLNDLIDVLVDSCERHLNEPVIERRVDDPTEDPWNLRMKEERRAAMFRVMNLAVAWRLTGDDRYAERAKLDLLTAAGFQDWYPRHFLNIGEMTALMALGYDWLYDYLTEEERATIRQGIVGNGLNPGLDEYDSNAFWVTRNNNWNQVCNGGLVLGALAVAEDEPELADEIITKALASIPSSLVGFEPDGDWYEGPTYWAYGATYNAMLIGSLRSALGDIQGLEAEPGYPEFGKSGLFHIQTVGPANLYYNFGDSKMIAYFSPVLFWLGREFEQPTYAWFERQLAEKDLPRMQRGDMMLDDTLDRFFALLIAWYSADGQSVSYDDLSLDTYFRGGSALGVMRSSWTDPDAIYFGFKGGYNQAAHGHMDIGSFVLDALGVRWAMDLRGDDYSLPGYFDFSDQRWDYYRLNNRGHGTLLIDDQIQNKNGDVSIGKFHSSEDLAWSTIDMTHAYQGQADSVRRGFAMLDRSRVLVEDDVTGVPEGEEIRWGIITPAAISVNGNKARLIQNGPSNAPEVSHLFPVEADTMIRGGSNANNNYGGRSTIDLKATGNDYTRKGYFRFDISTLPVDLSHVKRASLQFKFAKGGLLGSKSFEIFALHDEVDDGSRLGESWPEGTKNGDPESGALTWNNAPANRSGNEIDISHAASLEVVTLGSPATDSYLRYTSSPLDTFSNFIGADTNGKIGIIVRRTDEVDDSPIDFYSKESTEPEAEPAVLTLTTQEPGPEVAMDVEILQPEGAVFEVLPTDPGLPSGQNSNWGTRMLAIRLTADADPTRITVLFTPVTDGEPSAPTPEFRPLATDNSSQPEFSVQATAPTAQEWGAVPGEFSVRRSGDMTTEATVEATMSGTAESGVDYAAISSTASFVFPANSSIPEEVTVVPIPDDQVEGDETIRLTLESGAGHQLVAPTSATVVLKDLPRDEWRHTHGVVDWNAPAENGVGPLLSYALGYSPATPPALPEISMSTEAPTRLELQFDRPYPPPPDVEYRFEVTDDLGTWEWGPDHLDVLVSPPEGNLQRVIGRDRTPVGGASRRFMRLNVLPKSAP